MPVRAKFKCGHVSHGSYGSSIKLHAVYDSNPESENGKFFKATPNATVDLQIVNPDAAEQFVEGKEFYVDFTKVEKPA